MQASFNVQRSCVCRFFDPSQQNRIISLILKRWIQYWRSPSLSQTSLMFCVFPSVLQRKREANGHHLNCLVPALVPRPSRQQPQFNLNLLRRTSNRSWPRVTVSGIEAITAAIPMCSLYPLPIQLYRFVLAYMQLFSRLFIHGPSPWVLINYSSSSWHDRHPMMCEIDCDATDTISGTEVWSRSRLQDMRAFKLLLRANLAIMVSM